jgi:hypothetical protein
MRGNAAHRPPRFAGRLDLARGVPRCIPRRAARRRKSDPMSDPPPIQRRPSGSRTRQRSPVSVMLTPGERAKAEADANGRGLSLSGHTRALLMGAVTEGTPRRPPRDAADLARLLGQLGKVGSNLNQLTRLGHQGQLVPPATLSACVEEVEALTAEIVEVLHRDY